VHGGVASDIFVVFLLRTTRGQVIGPANLYMYGRMAGQPGQPGYRVNAGCCGCGSRDLEKAVTRIWGDFRGLRVTEPDFRLLAAQWLRNGKEFPKPRGNRKIRLVSAVGIEESTY
jgi:hypothetical protein